MENGDSGTGPVPVKARAGPSESRQRAPRLSAMGTTPLPSDALETTARNRQALSYQCGCLVRLIDELLKGETSAVELDASLFPDFRLPGDNPDDASRYLLRGLRNALRNFDGCLKSMTNDPAGPRSRLVTLRQVGLAVAQVFSTAPDSGPGRAILVSIANLLDQSGLMPWREFLSLYGGEHAKPWTAVDISGYARHGGGPALDAFRPRRRPAALAQTEGGQVTVKTDDEIEDKAKGKHKAKKKAKGKGKDKTKRKNKRKQKKTAATATAET